MSGLKIDLAATDDSATCRLEKTLDSLAVEVIDHFSLELTAFGLLPEHRLVCHFDLLDELFNTRFMHENVVRRDTDLTTVEEFAKGDL